MKATNQSKQTLKPAKPKSSTRKLIRQREGQVSILQLIGFGLVGVGVLCWLIGLIWPNEVLTGARVAIIFFITMLGIAFAFPEMLSDKSKGISTMRIVVFMIINVICMLILKDGWPKDTLTDIGINGYWVSIIAFTFGGKAAQAYFEHPSAASPNDLPFPPPAALNSTIPDTSSSTNGTLELIRTALQQHPFRQGEGIVGSGIGQRLLNGVQTPCLQINVSDPKWIPVYAVPFSFEGGNNQRQSITPYVVCVGTPKSHSAAGGAGITNIGGKNGIGTLGCIVIENDTNVKHILSCQHVLNFDFSYNQISTPGAIALAGSTGIAIAQHVKGFLDSDLDAAMARITGDTSGFGNVNLGIIKNPRDLTDDDISGNVQVHLSGYDISATGTSSIQRQVGVIVSREFYASLQYPDGVSHPFEDLIVLGKKDGSGFKTLSQHGYSGALVIDENSCPIGLLIGGDDNFSYAIPINKILNALGCTIAND